MTPNNSTKKRTHKRAQKYETVTVSLPEEITDWLRELARENMTGISAVVREVLLPAYRRENPPTKENP